MNYETFGNKNGGDIPEKDIKECGVRMFGS
jgi:hypothetical protein